MIIRDFDDFLKLHLGRAHLSAQKSNHIEFDYL